MVNRKERKKGKKENKEKITKEEGRIGLKPTAKEANGLRKRVIIRESSFPINLSPKWMVLLA